MGIPTTASLKEKAASKDDDDSAGVAKYDVTIQEHQIGVFRLLIAFENNSRGLAQYWKNFVPTTPLTTFCRLTSDIYQIAPGLLILYVLSLAWGGMHQAVEMAIMNRVLKLVEITLKGETGTYETVYDDVAWALGMLGSWAVMSAIILHFQNMIYMKLQARVQDHFRFRIMQADLKRDLPTSQDETTKQTLNALDVWYGFSGLLQYLQHFVSLASQLLVAAKITSNSGGPMFALACLAKPFFRQLIKVSVWDRVCLSYATNEYYIRWRGLQAMAKEEYRQDVISGNLKDWLLPEYLRMQEKLQDIEIEHPIYVYSKRNELPAQIIARLLESLPLMFIIANALLRPGHFSLSGLAILRSSTTSIQYCLETIMGKDAEMSKKLASIHDFYMTSEVKNVMEDGKKDYPHEKSDPDGMAFELRDINFSYPSSEKKEKSLQSINLSIPAGSVVVIVGANGSGKSTLIRLLARLYDPTSGSLLIDGLPSKEYQMSALREASVLLCQDHQVFPFSFRENIALGHPTLLLQRQADDDAKIDENLMELVKGAAEKGGARRFIEKMENGFETELDPRIVIMANKLEHHPDHPLQEEKKKIRKKSDISGGERQRVVASRAFMRMHSEKIRFVAVDEPTSALDAEGELQLFTRLLEERQGKTMIFVTHRFGYLTKHADMIVCMKDGEVVEVGSHSTLISKGNGEYAKLYNIQADAFN
ncbi:hypothetical protein H1R20_g11685, partial [Candolleomyces eurysporus]